MFYSATKRNLGNSSWRNFLAEFGNVATLVLSFVLEPIFMHTLCACSKQINADAWTQSAWEDVVVDAASIRPLGARAHTHFKLWRKAAVIHGPWAYENVEIMLSGIQMWRFAKITEGLGVRLSISSPLAKPCVTFHYDSLNRLSFGFASSKNIRAIFDEYQGTKQLKVCTPFFRGWKIGARTSGVATVDIVQSRMSLNTSTGRVPTSSSTHPHICVLSSW